MSKSSKYLKKLMPKAGWLIKYQGELGVLVRVYPGKVVKRWAKDLNKTNKEKAKLRYGVTIGFPNKTQYFTSEDFENSIRILSKDYNVGCLYALVRLDEFLFERLIAVRTNRMKSPAKRRKKMFECLFYNGWVDPPGYELLEIDTSKFGESPQEILANPEFKRAVEKCMKRYCETEEIDWDCIYLLNPDDLIRCSKLE